MSANSAVDIAQYWSTACSVSCDRLILMSKNPLACEPMELVSLHIVKMPELIFPGSVTATPQHETAIVPYDTVVPTLLRRPPISISKVLRQIASKRLKAIHN